MEPDPAAYPTLKFLNGFAEIQKTGNHLPHWQQDQATYFLTFRLADSIPVSLLDEWRKERNLWLMNHPKPWSTETEVEYHKLYSARIDQFLDQGLGSCLLGNSANSAIVAGAFHHFDHTRYLLHAWVIMPNHVHLLLSLGELIDLGETVASWKRFTAKKINRQRDGSGPVWQKDYFDRLIRDWDHFLNVARYIRRNPVKARLPVGAFVVYEAPWVARLLSSHGTAISESPRPMGGP
jgi:REP element-mobilizing transposase RayT